MIHSDFTDFPCGSSCEEECSIRESVQILQQHLVPLPSDASMNVIRTFFTSYRTLLCHSSNSTLNICAQRLGNGAHRVLDNFAGSGTTLLEASLLGMPSVGLDIDPLSVAIARAKMEIWQMTSHKFAEQAEQVIQSLNHQSSKQLELFTASQAVTSHASLVFPKKWLMKNRRNDI